jgi:hypothetical protein
MQKRKTFSAEFKRQAVRLMRESASPPRRTSRRICREVRMDRTAAVGSFRECAVPGAGRVEQRLLRLAKPRAQYTRA